jgi:hypothetical protein
MPCDTRGYAGENKKMPIPACVYSPTFDISAFVQERLRLSVFSYVWKPPDSPTLRMDRVMPLSMTKKNWRELESLYTWAKKTDPDEKIRMKHAHELWEQRQPGETMVRIIS